MIPILELRGGLLAASPALLNVPILKAIPICIIGNLLPIPFILLLIEKVLNGMERVPGLSKVAIWVRQKADKNKSQIEKFGFWGLVHRRLDRLPGRSSAPHEIRQSHWRDSLRNRHGHRDHVPFILRTAWRTLRLEIPLLETQEAEHFSPGVSQFHLRKKAPAPAFAGRELFFCYSTSHSIRN